MLLGHSRSRGRIVFIQARRLRLQLPCTSISRDAITQRENATRIAPLQIGSFFGVSIFLFLILYLPNPIVPVSLYSKPAFLPFSVFFVPDVIFNLAVVVSARGGQKGFHHWHFWPHTKVHAIPVEHSNKTFVSSFTWNRICAATSWPIGEGCGTASSDIHETMINVQREVMPADISTLPRPCVDMDAATRCAWSLRDVSSPFIAQLGVRCDLMKSPTLKRTFSHRRTHRAPLVRRNLFTARHVSSSRAAN